MSESVASIVLGVVSGIITSGVLFLAVQLFQTVFIPWYRNIIYTGIRIGGEWHSTDTPFEQNIKLEIRQHANLIQGLAVYVNPIQDEVDLERVRSFRVKGTIHDRFVQLRLTHTDESRIGVISYLLEIVGDGRRMLGAAAFYDLIGVKVSHGDISFKRYSARDKASSTAE